MMHSDSRVKEPVGLATTSVPDPCLSTYLSPRLREEPKMKEANAVLLMDKFIYYLKQHRLYTRTLGII